VSETAVEVTVVLKDCEKTLRHRELCYDPISMTPEDKRIQAFVKKAMESFQGEPDDISIKCSMEIQ